MNRPVDRILNRNAAFGWVAAVTCLLLAIPLIAMQFTMEVQWDVLDFVVMGALIFSAGSVFVLFARKASRKRRVLVGSLVAVVLLYIWAELAVGIFTSLGS